MAANDTAGQRTTEYEPLLAALRRIGRALDRGSRSLLARHGLTGPQILLLRQLAARPDMSVGELAGAAGLGQATVTDILGRLEQRGLVTRTRSETDRRRSVLRLTARANAMLEQVPNHFSDAFTQRFESLDTSERTRIVAAVQQLAALMEK